MVCNKIIDGLLDAVHGNIARATLFVADLSDGMVTCPRCDMPHTWSHPDHPPAACVWCSTEFSIRRRR